MVRASLVLPRRGMLLLTLSQFAIRGSTEDKFRDSFFDEVLGPYTRPFETLQEKEYVFQTVYGMSPAGGKSGPGKGVPKNTEGR